MLYEGVPIKKKKKEDLSHPAPKHEIVFGRDETIDALDDKYQAELEEEDNKRAPKDDAVFGREVRDREAFGRYLGKRKSMLDRITRFPFLNKKEIEEQTRMANGGEKEMLLTKSLPKETQEQGVPEQQETGQESREVSEAQEAALLVFINGRVHMVGEKLRVNQVDQNRIAFGVLDEALKNPDLTGQEIDTLVKEGYRSILGDQYKELAKSTHDFVKEGGGLADTFEKMQKKGLFNYSMMVGELHRMVKDYKQNLLPMHEYFKDEQYDFSNIDNYDEMLGDGNKTIEHFNLWRSYLEEKEKSGEKKAA